MALASRERRLLGLWKPAASLHADEAMELLDQVGMAGHARRACGVLAYGDVKRVELAIALSNRPKLLLMDEPTAGMAPQERNELMTLTRRLVREHNIGVLFTEHSMDVVFEYADKLIVLARGKVIAEGSAETVRNHPRVQEVYLGTGKSFTPRATFAGGVRR
jgi:branched-chain amino acid transport system ATP-binding protein